MNLVVANLKGGVGKTTTALYLAGASLASGYERVTLVDADRQASAAEWLDASPIEGIESLEAPSERTLARAMARRDSMVIVDMPPGDERLMQAALKLADAVVIPTRVGGVEYAPAVATIAAVGEQAPYGLVVCAARLGTNDLEAALAWWRQERMTIWGIVPERVGIAAGPEARLYREGLDEYEAVLKRAIRKRPG